VAKMHERRGKLGARDRLGQLTTFHVALYSSSSSTRIRTRPILQIADDSDGGFG